MSATSPRRDKPFGGFLLSHHYPSISCECVMILSCMAVAPSNFGVNVFGRYNSAIFSTQPTSSVKALVVTPGFVTGAPIDAEDATTVAMSRRNMTIQARQQLPPYSLVESRVDANWGHHVWDFNVTAQCNPDGCHSDQQKALNGTFSKRLDTATCLTTYLSLLGNRSDVLLVSTTDLLRHEQSSLPSNNSLLFAFSFGGLLGSGLYWECGSTNTFDCRKPNSWEKNYSIIENWNIIGYKIDYCLISEIPLSKLCSVQYSLPIMMSTTHLNEYLD